MRNQLKTFYSVLAVVATLGLTTSVHGVPAFARQTGLDCTSCHAASGFPTLNAFGQAFKAGGYTQANEDNLMGDGEALSLPKTLNLTVVYKAQAPVTGSSVDGTAGATQGDWMLPDEMAIVAGGRIGKNVGFLMETSTLPQSVTVPNMKVVFAPEIGPVRLGIVPWLSDGNASYVFETLSTGAASMIRPSETAKGAATHMITGNSLLASIAGGSFGGNGLSEYGEMAGLGLYVWHPMGFVAFTPFFGRDATGTPAPWLNDKNAASIAENIGYYVRAAVTPTFGNTALGVGIQYWSGGYTDGVTTYNATNKNALNALVIDAQAMMDVGIPLSIYATFGLDQSGANATGIKISSDYAITAYVEAGIVPDVFMAGLNFEYAAVAVDALGTTINFTNTVVGVALKYHVVRNVKLELDFNYAMFRSDATGATKNDSWELAPIIFGAF